jgi:peptide/nickel transport system substrate-binding protein
MNGFQMPHQAPAYDPSRPAYQINREEARRLLAEAGYSGELITYRTLPNYYVNGLAAAQVMQQWWQEVGLNVEIEIKETFGQVNDEELMSRNWSNGFWLADPAAPLTSDWTQEGFAGTRYLWDSPQEFRDLLESIRTLPEGPERTVAFQRAIDIWDDEAPATPLYRPYELYGVRKDVAWRPVTFEWMDLRPHNLGFS